jgi:putative spermidine/putrescine transport system permease protein
MASLTGESSLRADALPAQQGPSRARDRLLAGRRSLAWVGVVPFFAYITVFLLLPTVSLAIGAFQTASGAWTLDHVRALFQPQYTDSFKTSIRLSVITALSGGLLGLLVAYAAVRDGAPRWLRSTLITFSGVAANFAGVPLAFAFVSTLGINGIVTVFFSSHGFNPYDHGFALFHLTGLALAYTYFQFPLMVLIISPALDGLHREWREAATNLGAGTFQFWRLVGLPVLLPSLLGALVLLFGNAFAAYATAYALVGGSINLVPIQIGSLVSGEFTSNAQLADALALGMIVVIAVSVTVYAILMRRASRWTR